MGVFVAPGLCLPKLCQGCTESVSIVSLNFLGYLWGLWWMSLFSRHGQSGPSGCQSQECGRGLSDLVRKGSGFPA